LSDFNEATEPAPEPVIPAPEKPEPMTVVSEMPSFPGGLASMITFIKSHLRYPREARESNITGTVYLNFVVETDGSITEMVVARPIGGGCEEEAIRVLSSMPKWIPGKQNGRAVRVRLTLPVKFVLND
jgi:protein TonB